jgi:hypothetical protein
MTIESKLILLAQAVGADVKALKLADGDLTSLSTTAKGNLVASINELFDLLASAGVAIDDTAGTGDTDVVWSADKSVFYVTAAVATLEASLMGGAGSAYDTFKELQDLIIADQSGLAALAADIANRVRFDAAQVLSGPQKDQARTNIGAVSQADIDATIVATVGDVAHDFVADYVAAKA